MKNSHFAFLLHSIYFSAAIPSVSESFSLFWVIVFFVFFILELINDKSENSRKKATFLELKNAVDLIEKESGLTDSTQQVSEAWDLIRTNLSIEKKES